MRIITAIGIEKIIRRIKNEIKCEILGLDIIYEDGIIENIQENNNIDYIKYKVITKKITKGSESGEDGSSQQSNEEQNTEQTGGTNSNKQESNKSVSNDESSEQNNEGENSDKVFSMKSNNILDGQVNINWTELKSEIENFINQAKDNIGNGKENEANQGDFGEN